MTADPNSQETHKEVSQRWLSLLFTAGLALVLAGVFAVFSATLIDRSSGSVGVVIFVGPIPIAIGAGPDAELLILSGFILTAIVLLTFLIMRKKITREFNQFK